MLNTFELLAQPEVYLAYRLRSLRYYNFGPESMLPASTGVVECPLRLPQPLTVKKLAVGLRGAFALLLLLQVRFIPVILCI